MTDIPKKVWPKYFQKVLSGEKKVELRLADFEINSGDVLVLEEWDPETKKYAGRKIRKKISYLMKTKDAPFWTKEEIDKYGYQVLQMDDEEKQSYFLRLDLGCNLSARPRCSASLLFNSSICSRSICFMPGPGSNRVK